MRITMNTIMRQYNTQLSRVMQSTARASMRVTTGRLFEKPSEDPSAAVRASQLRRQISKNSDYLTNLRDTIGLFEVAEASMMNISKIAEDARIDLLEAVNGQPPMGSDERKIYAAKLRTMREQMVMDANARYGDAYLFGGSSTKVPPFSIGSGGEILFRGIDVNTTDPAELATLQRMSEEELYIDLGFGLTFDSPGSNAVTRGSAFNVAFPGVRFLGFGQNDDGLPNNIMVMLGEIADALEDNDYSHDKIAPYMDHLTSLHKSILTDITQIGASSLFMNLTERRLDDAHWVLLEKSATTELIDTEYAITMWQMEHTAYMAALKMGPNIITPSFIDFMR